MTKNSGPDGLNHLFTTANSRVAKKTIGFSFSPAKFIFSPSSLIFIRPSLRFLFFTSDSFMYVYLLSVEVFSLLGFSLDPFSLRLHLGVWVGLGEYGLGVWVGSVWVGSVGWERGLGVWVWSVGWECGLGVYLLSAKVFSLFSLLLGPFFAFSF
ncbi:hypothetical protein RhiirA5_383657, partial [Rhizophagus irregularis]